MSAGSSKARTFLRQFADFGAALKNSEAKLTVHYVLYECESCKKNGYSEEHKDCLAGGRYCNPDPDGLGESTGRDVVLEDLRELCILQLGKGSNSNQPWFEYMSYLDQNCYNNSPSGCSDSAMRLAEIDKSAVERCMESSVVGTNNALDDNSLLKREGDAWNVTETVIHPSITINHQLYRGNLDDSSVIQALCAAYSKGDVPEICSMVSGDNEYKVDSPTSQVYLFLLIGGCAVIVVGVFVVYRKWLRRKLTMKIREDVNIVVAQYFELNEKMGVSESGRPVVKGTYY